MRSKYILWVMIIIIFSGSVVSCSKDETERVSISAGTTESEKTESGSVEEEAEYNRSEQVNGNGQSQSSFEDRICVYVCGAVETEGVYELPEGSRVYEAIEMAGGLTDEAATGQINQAEILTDEMQIYIPTKEEVTLQILQREEETDGKININTATKEELMKLSGVGEAKAESIINYREEHGSFQKIEDIMQISGIKEGMFQKIKDKIKV